MASPFLLQNAFEGMWQDSPRDMLPAGKLWSMTDLIPSFLGAPAQGREGWSTASTLLGSCTNVLGLLYADTINGTSFAIGSDNHLYSFTTSSNVDIGAAVAVAQNPILHRTGSTPLVVIPASGGSTAPKSYDGSTLQNLAGSPPDGIYADVWNDHTMLANSTGEPQRLWFSPVGDAAATWDTTNSWIDLRTAIVGIAAIRTGIVVFHNRTIDMLTGTTPPSATSIGDLTERSAAFNVGCIDARTIVKYNDTVIWADAQGVYQTDGNTLKDLTAEGMKLFWTTLMSSLPGPGRTSIYTNIVICAGVQHDTYFITVSGQAVGVRNPIVTLAYDLLNNFWYQVSNFHASCYARQGRQFEDTFMGLFASGGSSNGGTVASIGSIFNGGGPTDSDGTTILPEYETSFYRGWARFHRKWVPSMALQSWRRMYLSYLLTDNSGSNPFLTVSYATDQNASSYKALSPTLAATDSTYHRVHRDLHFQAAGVMFKVQQTNSSDETMLHAIEIEYSPLEGSRLAQ